MRDIKTITNFNKIINVLLKNKNAAYDFAHRSMELDVNKVVFIINSWQGRLGKEFEDCLKYMDLEKLFEEIRDKYKMFDVTLEKKVTTKTNKVSGSMYYSEGIKEQLKNKKKKIENEKK